VTKFEIEESMNMIGCWPLVSLKWLVIKLTHPLLVMA